MVETVVRERQVAWRGIYRELGPHYELAGLCSGDTGGLELILPAGISVAKPGHCMSPSPPKMGNNCLYPNLPGAFLRKFFTISAKENADGTAVGVWGVEWGARGVQR